MPRPRNQTQPQGGANIFKRFTSKLRSSSAPAGSESEHRAPEKETKGKKRGVPLRMPPMPKAPVPAPPPNDFTSREQRQAALRARGLLPAAPAAYRDANGFMVPLSEQEAELDRRYTVVVEEKSGSDGEAESEAKKIREAWLARNKDASIASTPRTSTSQQPSADDGVALDAPHPAPGVALAANPDAIEESRTTPNTPAEPESSAPSTPNRPPGSPSSHSTEKVSRWLRSSTDVPTPLAVSTDPSTVEPLVRVESPSMLLTPTDDEPRTPEAASPAATVRAKPRKEKPSPIVVTAQHTSKESDAKGATQVIAVAVSALSDSEASTSDERPSSEAHRGLTSNASAPARPAPLAHANSTTSSGSQATTRTTNTLPALSPTRTVSSSGAESTLPTPTTTSCARDVSISRGSASDHSHRPRRGTGGALDAPPKALGGLMQSSIAETDSSEEGEGEFGASQSMPAVSSAVPRARPVRAQTAGQAAEAQTNRKSFSLFGKKSLDLGQGTRSSSSMSNLRRAFSGGLTSKLQPRPLSSIEPSSSQPAGVGRKRSKMFDASHLPSSPPPVPVTMAVPVVPPQGRTPGVGLRPRQAVAPTMHSRGSILHQAHFIEDDESRRLSEMAFLT